MYNVYDVDRISLGKWEKRVREKHVKRGKNSLNKKIFYAIFVQGCTHTFSHREKMMKKKKNLERVKTSGINLYIL